MDYQAETLRTYAHDHSFDVVREFRFQESADKRRRKKFQEMIDFVRKDKSINAIIGFRVDRLTRNYRDQVVLDELRESHGKELHFVHDRLVITAQSVGREITEWDTKVYLAKTYLNRLKEDAIDSAKYKIASGQLPGKASYGFRNTRRDGKGWVEVQQPEADIVTRIGTLYALGGCSMAQVRDRIREEFGVWLHVSKIDHILNNPFYWGLMRIKGKTHPHVYPKLFSLELSEQIRRRKSVNRDQPRKYAGIPFPYRGLIRCADCGCAVSAERKVRGDRVYDYYRCTQSQGKHGAKFLSGREADEQFAQLFDRLAIPEEVAERIGRALGVNQEAQAKRLEQKRSQLAADRRRHQGRLEVLYEDRLDGLISREQYDARRSESEAEIRAIDEKLGNLEASSEQEQMVANKVLALCSRAAHLYRVAKADQKRAILRSVLSNCSLKGKRLLWELKKPFDAVSSFACLPIWQPLEDVFRDKKLEFDVKQEDLDATLQVFGCAEANPQLPSNK